MSGKSVPSTVTDFLAAHGAGFSGEDVLNDLPALVRVFRESVPAEGSDPLSPENLTLLTAALDCISVMDERLYEHYRAMIDLFRAGFFRIPAEKLRSSPSWDGLREKAVRLGLAPEDLYGDQPSRPHPGMPEVWLRLKGGECK